MNFNNVSVLSVSHLDAPHRVTSEEIERRLEPTMKRLGIRSDLLRQLSGIMERRVWDEGTMPSEAAAKAKARPTPVSIIPPARKATPATTAASWAERSTSRPPT